MRQREAGAGQHGRQEPRGGDARRRQGDGGGRPDRGRFRRRRTALHGDLGGRVRRWDGRVPGAPGREGAGAPRVGRLRRGRRPRADDIPRGAAARGTPHPERRRPGRRDHPRRARHQGARLPRRQLPRADHHLGREARHGVLQRGDIWARARLPRSRDAGRGHRADKQQPARQRDGDLHGLGRRRPQVPERDRRRHGRDQRADPRAAAVLLLHRVEGLLPRRPAHVREGHGRLLHPHQDRDGELEARHGRAESPRARRGRLLLAPRQVTHRHPPLPAKKYGHATRARGDLYD
mmetsp:Transcript_15921/g.37725  ORF Transcript_15921/g.37725 Transcript_15921/m.37725 type:complete len:292 (+) Transcript_15921:943-1818(+)